MIVTIKTAELTSGDYGEFIKITGFDGAGKETFKNVSVKFEDKWPLLEENATVEFVMKKKDNKWIIDDIKPIELPTVAKEAVKEGAVVESAKPKEKVGKVDDKNRSYALSYAKDIAVGKMGIAGEVMTTEKLVEIAKRFCKYLDTGE